ncbi:hypothetical protein Y032_0268g800 [Ancylostoma ceylanicum]|uniref:Paired domain-containing protein n=1 Tax=Ancylostoma ceylanicum TaxID=53326 RepID=A0A016SA31_9BILA|nr:hypothetical protein Y032_0268g800 [Ancylostoma ceylanicum]
MTSLEDQITVVAMHKRGSSVSVISKALKLHREQVHQVISRFGETEGIENRPRGRPNRTARTPTFRNAVKNKLRRNPGRSIGQLAKDHKISHAKTDQRLFRVVFYKFAGGQRLTGEMKASRMKKIGKVMTLACGDKLGRIFLTDEKIFTPECAESAGTFVEGISKSRQG